MTDQEKVIESLDRLSDWLFQQYQFVYGGEAPNYYDAYNTVENAIDLLKEQRAHIMTIDQLEDALDTVVWLETPMSENLADGYSLIMAYSHKCGWMLFDSPFGDNPSQDRLEYSEYSKSWRCWNKRPTDEQRQAVKWE